MRRKNMTTKVKKTVALFMATALVLGCGAQHVAVKADQTTAGSSAAATGTSVATTDTGNGSSKSSTEDYSSERITTNYSKVSEKYTLKDYTGEAVSYDISKAVKGKIKEKLTAETKDYTKAEEVLDLTAGDSVDLEVDVPEDGLYDLNLDYYSHDASILPVSMEATVDGKYPFYEARNLKFETTWKLADTAVKDRYNKEVVAVPQKVYQWETKGVSDSSYRNSDPLKVQLTKGKHEIKFSIKEGNF